MNVTYACCQCDRTNRQDLDDDSTRLSCIHCGHEQGIPAGAVRDGQVTRCVVCPSDDLFIRKNFSQRIGLTIIVVGFVASSVAWFYYRQYLAFGILVGTALLDVLLYVLVGNLLQCYRCRAEYRDLKNLEEYGAFSLETHERHRQQEARLSEAEKSLAAQRSTSNLSEDQSVGGDAPHQPADDLNDGDAADSRSLSSPGPPAQ